MAQCGISVTYESIRLWCNKFGSKYAAKLRRRHQGYGDTFFIDEVFIKIDGKQRYLWRAVCGTLVSAETYRYFRLRSFASWKNAAMV
ncbi:MAG: IS6 family transposase [Pseudomonadales bacterium]|nr:IS6 family transposase [Pseudomonadales bacterium]